MNFRKNYLFVLITLLTLGLAYAAVTDFTEYLPIDQRTSAKVEKWNTLFGLFTQKAGDTMTGDLGITTGNLKINTAGKGLVIKESTSTGRLGQIAFSTGGLTVYSNATVTASTRAFLQCTTANANFGSMTCTNIVGVGIQLIPAVSQTNTYNVFLIEGQ